MQASNCQVPSKRVPSQDVSSLSMLSSHITRKKMKKTTTMHCSANVGVPSVTATATQYEGN